MCIQLLTVRGKDLGRRDPVSESLDRDGDGAIPEFVERKGELPDDRTGRKNVVVAKLRIRVDLKILIADIAAADKRDRIVDDQ